MDPMRRQVHLTTAAVVGPESRANVIDAVRALSKMWASAPAEAHILGPRKMFEIRGGWGPPSFRANHFSLTIKSQRVLEASTRSVGRSPLPRPAPPPKRILSDTASSVGGLV